MDATLFVTVDSTRGDWTVDVLIENATSMLVVATARRRMTTLVSPAMDVMVMLSRDTPKIRAATVVNVVWLNTVKPEPEPVNVIVACSRDSAGQGNVSNGEPHTDDAYRCSHLDNDWRLQWRQHGRQRCIACTSACACD